MRIQHNHHAIATLNDFYVFFLYVFVNMRDLCKYFHMHPNYNNLYVNMPYEAYSVPTERSFYHRKWTFRPKNKANSKEIIEIHQK